MHKGQEHPAGGDGQASRGYYESPLSPPHLNISWHLTDAPKQPLPASATHLTNTPHPLPFNARRYEVDAWYFSPYPEPFASQRKLYVCEYTLK